MDRAAYSFGPFVLDPADRRLLRDGAPVEVTARYFDALLLLVGENGRLVSKDRFHDEVWSGIPVTDEALTQCIRTLRRALGDDAASPKYIETVPRHGYRFVATVEAPPDPPAATAAPGRTQFALSDIAAASLGGGVAGMVGALGYLSLGLAAPGMGAASTLLVLVSLNLLLGLIAGASVGAGIALAAGWRGAWTVAGGAAGGLVVGAAGHMVGNDLFELFFGRAPGATTGAWEGLFLGAATGAGAWLAESWRDRAWPARLAPGFLAGALAGLSLAATGGRLMVGSLAALADRFPGTRLQFEAFSPALLTAAMVAEASLFAGGVSAAIAIGRRVRA